MGVASAGEELLLSTPAYAISGRRVRPRSVLADAPLLVAIPGGGYGWRYFDVEGHSLLQRAQALGIPALALDRPGYGASTAVPAATLAGNAERLNAVVEALWAQEGGEAPGVVLVGHSIGGAIALAMAAGQPRFPLIGVAVSGVGLTPPPAVADAWAALPELPLIEPPAETKQQAMFGPAWTYDAQAPGLSRRADAPVPRAELIEIVSWWPDHALELAAQVSAPVHYRLGAYDGLWVSSEADVRRFAEGFTASPSVDAKLYPAAGHCIDFHRCGAAFQLEQLAFALGCAGPQEPR